ncbi:MAG: helix-turn-helix transcriptional regulator [Solibacillus sp.]|uniref:helix-turn-helix transcriptional regulator n=1 Tax=Solibacillus sp. TaxID=1909654 RepID=UPI0033162109
MKNNMKDLRARLEFSQDVLAEKLRVSRQTIISLEKGSYNPSITLEFKLARLFNCHIEDIFIYEEDNE